MALDLGNRRVSGGQSFDDPDVVAAYMHRTPYPPALHERLVELAVGRGALLDLGCGPGKLAGALAGRFRRVDAIDLSAAMIEAGRTAHPDPNIRWTAAPAETAALHGPYDLIVAGASIHWMDHAVVMPRLADALAPGAKLALVNGDGAYAAPWKADFIAFLARWVEVFGDTWNSAGVVGLSRAHDAWFDEEGQEAFSFTHRQDLASLIAMEHSRATWTHARMGRELADKFDAELAELLGPYVVDGMVEFEVGSVITWGQPRRAAKA